MGMRDAADQGSRREICDMDPHVVTVQSHRAEGLEIRRFSVAAGAQNEFGEAIWLARDGRRSSSDFVFSNLDYSKRKHRPRWWSLAGSVTPPHGGTVAVPSVLRGVSCRVRVESV